MTIAVNKIESVTQRKLVTESRTVTEIVVRQVLFDRSNRTLPGGLVLIRTAHRDAAGDRVLRRSYLFSGDYFKAQMAVQVPPLKTQIQAIDILVGRMVAAVEGDAALQQTLLDSGELLIDAPARFSIELPG